MVDNDCGDDGNDCHHSRCDMVPHCAFDLHFSDSLILSICHLCVYRWGDGHKVPWYGKGQSSHHSPPVLPHPPLSAGIIGMFHNQLYSYILSGEIFTVIICPVLIGYLSFGIMLWNSLLFQSTRLLEDMRLVRIFYHTIGCPQNTKFKSWWNLVYFFIVFTLSTVSNIAYSKAC